MSYSSLALRLKLSVRSKLRVAFGASLAALLPLTAAAYAAEDAPHPTSSSLRRPVDAGSLTVVGTPARSLGPNVFGTIALPAGTTPLSARWTRILTARNNEPILSSLAAEAQAMSRERQAAFVQSRVNRAVHRRSGQHCRFDDGYWASAGETIARGMGDCIDIAVAKMEALRRLGFSGSDLYLTTGRIAGSGFEAALLVRIADRFLLLDEHSDHPVEAFRTRSFEPTLTYGTGMTWAHGRPYIAARGTN